MASYLLIESRDPFDSGDTEFSYELARGLAEAGHAVTVFLVQNGVLPARPGARSEGLRELLGAGVEVLADEFSLRERGIVEQRIVEGIRSAPIDVVIDHLEQGSKAIWH